VRGLKKKKKKENPRGGHGSEKGVIEGRKRGEKRKRKKGKRKEEGGKLREKEGCVIMSSDIFSVHRRGRQHQGGTRGGGRSQSHLSSPS
jgi:hypothetical protein